MKSQISTLSVYSCPFTFTRTFTWWPRTFAW